MTWTRRSFLEAVGRAGGAVAVYEAMTTLGMIPVPEAQPLPQLPRDFGKGKSVVILGAGVAGLTAAYELNRIGYDVTVLEAQGRVGGRSFTVRPGDKIVEHPEGGGAVTEQTCKFDDGLYLNAGPGRIPYHHTHVLDYCRLLGVPLEMYVMSCRPNLFQKEHSFDDAPIPNRRVANDTRGYIAEMLAKCVDKGSFDKELTANDKKLLLDLLVIFGTLTKKYKYKGSSRSGYLEQPAVVTPGVTTPKLDFTALLRSEFWKDMFYQPEDYLWQPTLFQPVGGMDQIVHGFMRQVCGLVRINRAVTGINNIEDGKKVRVNSKNTRTGQDEPPIVADWCISTIPLPVLAGIKDNNFSKEFVQAIGSVEFEATCKVGWQSNRRFWEEQDQIYGGISYIKHNITQMWYPSSDFLAPRGVLTGAYNYLKDADEMADKTLEGRLELAAQGAKRLHPKADWDKWVPRELGLSIAWKNIEYQRGGWAMWDHEKQKVEYNTLLEPDGHIAIAGDQLSYLPGWQEGAILSAHHVMRFVTGREEIVLRKAMELAPAPDTRSVTQGYVPPED